LNLARVLQFCEERIEVTIIVVLDKKMNSFTILVLVLHLASGQSSVSPLARLRAKIPVDPVTDFSPVKSAGQYANPGKELIRRIGGALSGDVLYIFPDNTYVYCEWADIMPTTIFDKGSWDLSDGVLKLTSSPEITWNPMVERRFLVVHRRSQAAEILLVGIDKQLPNFEEQAGDDPETMLLIVAKQRESTISQAKAAQVKAKLIRESWRPDYFRKQP
jgi:hypothetical protein